MTTAYALIATIPARRPFCERLLRELARQSRKPDGVIFVLDGYGDLPAPACSLPVVREHRTAQLSGAGQRWLRCGDLDPEDIIVNLDDDIVLAGAPSCFKTLADTAEQHKTAAAAMGRTARNKVAPPGLLPYGALIHAAGCGLTVRVKHLVGLQEFATSIKAQGGPDGLGPGGDDDGLVSAYLWRSGVVITHAPTGNIFQAPGAQSGTTPAAKKARLENLALQKKSLKNLTGWPWPMA